MSEYCFPPFELRIDPNRLHAEIHFGKNDVRNATFRHVEVIGWEWIDDEVVYEGEYLTWEWGESRKTEFFKDLRRWNRWSRLVRVLTAARLNRLATRYLNLPLKPPYPCDLYVKSCRAHRRNVWSLIG